MRTNILVLTLFIFAVLTVVSPYQEVAATSPSLLVEVSRPTATRGAVFKDVDRHKLIPPFKKPVAPPKGQPTFPLGQETSAYGSVADLDDFRACYNGCRGFGGTIVGCTIICTPVIFREVPN